MRDRRLAKRSKVLPGVGVGVFSFVVACGAAGASSIPSRSGSIKALVANLQVMRRASRAYTPPSGSELQLARRGFRQLITGRLAGAKVALGLLGFELFVLHDGGRQYHVVRESSARKVSGWGFFVFNPTPRHRLVLEAPHARHDRKTGQQAADLMKRLGARALLLSTAFRCATPKQSHCSGRTRACTRGRRLGKYRLSDMAHTRLSIFQVVHEVLAAATDTVVVQLHGFARRPGRRYHVIVSDGTHTRRTVSWPSNALVAEVRDELARRHRRGVVSCNESHRVPLCGTDNVQGRQMNGSSDPCRQDASRASGRFLHIEQSHRARRRGSRYYTALALGLAAWSRAHLRTGRADTHRR